jgi:DNA processing protein
MRSPEDLRMEIALSLVPRIGPRTFLRLLNRFGSASAVFESGLLPQHPDFREVDRILTFCRKYSVRVLSILDSSYPSRLTQCPDPPSILYYKGNADLNQARVLSVIGTRRPSEYGRALTGELIKDLSGYGILVVSGLADGIDGLAHRHSLEHNQPTVGILAHGLQMIYPADHRLLARQMLENGGLITEFPPGTPAKKEYFSIRNRIIAGLADALLVIESKASGGCMITAKLASSYHREIYAVPGRLSDTQSQGCHWLIRSNLAQLVTSGKDIAEDLNWPPPDEKHPHTSALSIPETLLLGQFSKIEASTIDDLQRKTNLPVPDLMAALLSLELNRFIEPLPGKRYRLL